MVKFFERKNWESASPPMATLSIKSCGMICSKSQRGVEVGFSIVTELTWVLLDLSILGRSDLFSNLIEHSVTLRLIPSSSLCQM